MSGEQGVFSSKVQEFQVYRGLLCFDSGYYNNLLNGAFADSGKDLVTIKDLSLSRFKTILLWLNTRRLHAPLSAALPLPLSFPLIFELYVFGDKYIVPRLKNAAVEACIEKIHRKWSFPSKTSIEYLYNNITNARAPLRKLIIELYVTYANFEDRPIEEYHRNFLADVIYAQRDLVRQMQSTRVSWYNYMKGRICEFHDHREPSSSGT